MKLLGIKRLRDGRYEVAKYYGYYVVPNLWSALRIALTW